MKSSIWNRDSTQFFRKRIVLTRILLRKSELSFLDPIAKFFYFILFIKKPEHCWAEFLSIILGKRGCDDGQENFFISASRKKNVITTIMI